MYIKELEKNKYRVWVDLDPDYTGKRRRKSKVIQAKTKRELQAKINAWTDSINNISECKTVSDMCNEVWPQIVANKSPNTVYGYNAAKKRIDNSIGSLDLNKLTPRALQKWVNDLSETLSPKTVVDTYSILRMCCSIATSWELLRSSPCHDVFMPKNRKKEIEILSKDDFARFCANLDKVDIDTRVCFELALFGSLRRGEIMGLHEDDIQDDGRFYVQRTRYTRLGEDFIKDTKTESGERLCILPDPVVKDIKALKRYHIERKLALGGGLWDDNPYLIKNPDGTPYHTHKPVRELKKYMESIGLQPITLHALRHTYASICISMGIDPATVSKRMGHANVSTTLSIYTHLFENQSDKDEISLALGTMMTNCRQAEN